MTAKICFEIFIRRQIVTAGSEAAQRRFLRLSLGDAVAIIVGIVIGAGIFKTPPLVAANGGSEGAMLLGLSFFVP